MEQSRKIKLINNIMNLNSILDRLKEPSTYRGLTIILALVGVKLSPDQATSIATAAAGIIGAIEVFRKESASSADKIQK